MGTRKRFMIDTHFDLVDKGAVNEFFCKKMVLFVSSLWFSVTTYMLSLFRFLNRYLFRFHVDDEPQKGNPSSSAVIPQDDILLVSNSSKPEPEPEVIEFEDSEYDGFGEKELPKFSFKFQFQTSDDTRRSNEESSVTVDTKKALAASSSSVPADPDEALVATSTSKYEFSPSKNFCGFMEEPEVLSFTVKEVYMNTGEDSIDNEEIVEDGFLSEKDFPQQNLDKEAIPEGKIDDSCGAEESEKPETLIVDEFLPSGKNMSVHFGRNSPDTEDFSDEIQLLSEKEFLGFDSDLESVSFGDRYSVLNNMIDSSSEAFLSDGDCDSECEPENIMEVDEEKTESGGGFQNSEERNLENPGTLDPGEVGTSDQLSSIEDLKEFDEEKTESVEGLQDSKEINLGNARMLDHAEVDTSDQLLSVENFMEHFDEEIDLLDDIQISGRPHFEKLSDPETEAQLEREYHELEAECKREDSGGKGAGLEHGSEETKEKNLQNPSYSDPEDSNDFLWEHQHLIEQLKMELKKVKATGLPTILEESESPRMSSDLKPWKIEEKFVHEDRIDELHKFYRTYRERMRKFDILNYQKMYALGFLQLKDPLQSISTGKSSTPTLTSVLSKGFRLSKRRQPEEDSTMKFVREVQSDLEVVYVGQVCLSWEFLHWQYGKARELLESDPYETMQYNLVAGEFQQFQVLMQRFLEDERFQGPRVQNYIKNRCILRNLLQVPVIKEDPKDKEGRRRSKDGITCSMLWEIIEESMRIFWDFIRADKDEGNVIFKGLLRPQVELMDPVDSQLLVEVQTTLQKKEKKLKDILRSGNCIVRRFQKHHEEERPDQLLFFSQIDLKLISRVLKMSRITTDQLVWCHKKLSKINFVHRKVHVEPSYLLFPC